MWDPPPVAVVQLIIGILLLTIGGVYVTRREQIAARQDRSAGGQLRSPSAYLVIGTVLALAGLLQVVLALR
jgi:hypothetical protein